MPNSSKGVGVERHRDSSRTRPTGTMAASTSSSDNVRTSDDILLEREALSSPPASASDKAGSASAQTRTTPGNDALGLGTDAIWERGIWWDGVGNHQDHFIDLEGTSTDHLPDVRMYLILMGSGEEPPVWKVSDEEKDLWRIEHGKALLRKAWYQGHGAFLDPKKPGRTYEPVAGDDHFPVFGVPWYGDLRVKEERVEGYGDAGIVHAPDFILQDNWDMHPQAVTSDWTIKTNLRVPLPPKRFVSEPPTGRESWRLFITGLYDISAHPAAIAVNCSRAMTNIELDYEKYWFMSAALGGGWMALFPDLDDDED